MLIIFFGFLAVAANVNEFWCLFYFWVTCVFIFNYVYFYVCVECVVVLRTDGVVDDSRRELSAR